MLLADPFLLWAVTGLASGLVLGIGGSGGGIVAIPLLIYLGGLDVKDATSYGLLVSAAGSFLTWFSQREKTVFPVVLGLIIPAVIFAKMLAPFKSECPSWVIALMLNAVCVFSLYSLWFARHEKYGAHYSNFFRIKNSLAGGAMAGALNTMTGLGGGVIMVPWLVRFTRLNMDEAVACSLLTISMIAPFSVWSLHKMDLDPFAFFALVVGVIVAVFVIRQLMKVVDETRMNSMRKLTLTVVTVFSMVAVISGL